MTLMHQKQSIEDCVTDQVLRWEDHNCIDIRLTCGYGPPLEWRVYEFVPRTMELLGQYQYRQDKLGVTRRLTKYSPPLGLMQIDTSDSIRAELYLDRALQPEHLHDFGWTCFEEESQRLQLQLLLQKIIRMMAITYIMGHTLTIEEDDFFSVINSISRTGVPKNKQPFTSPRLANRQLKFFFSILRGTIYDNILNWQQQTLHSSVKRESTWLAAFCVMLGFGMVLEEAQHTIILQADAKISKGEMTADAANKEAENACQRIDERYTFLIRLFQCKYRDKKWTRGSFGNGTPELKDPHAQTFLHELYTNVVDNRKSRLCIPLLPSRSSLLFPSLTPPCILTYADPSRLTYSQPSPTPSRSSV
nr:hypothetical protein CFP56_04245 [Quercus suber]